MGRCLIIRVRRRIVCRKLDIQLRKRNGADAGEAPAVFAFEQSLQRELEEFYAIY